ncbi:MAG: glycosyltransferase family 4 protein [Bacteroidales bacterium]
MKKIISFTDYYWPGYKAGGTVRAFMNQVDFLKNEFEFYIVTRNTDYTESMPYEGITPDRWTVIAPNVNVYYISAANQTSKTFSAILKETRYDVVYIHLLFGFSYSILPLLLSKRQKYSRIIICPHGNLGSGALAVKPLRKKLFLGAARLTGYYNGTVFHSVTSHETVDIQAHIGKNTRILLARELPRKAAVRPSRKPKIPGKLSMVTVARISPEKNQLYALEILSQCKDHAISYDLIGPVYDEAYWNKCKLLIDAMPPNIRINYRGSINSEKIPDELQTYDLMLLPTTGENFGHTILESFMAGCPVIISDRTPWKSLENAGIGRDIPLENPGSFKEAVEFFASMDSPSFEIFSANAFNYAQAYVSNPEMLSENINLFNL